MTTTHVRYFDDEALVPLVEAVEALAADWEERRPHVEPLVAVAGDVRLSAARAAVILLAEPVAESMFR